MILTIPFSLAVPVDLGLSGFLSPLETEKKKSHAFSFIHFHLNVSGTMLLASALHALLYSFYYRSLCEQKNI